MTDKGKKEIKLEHSDVVCYLKNNPEIVFSVHEAIFEGMVAKFGIDNVDHPLFKSLVSFGELATLICDQMGQSPNNAVTPRKFDEPLGNRVYPVGTWVSSGDELLDHPGIEYVLECVICHFIPYPSDPFAGLPNYYVTDIYGNRHYRSPDNRYMVYEIKDDKYTRAVDIRYSDIFDLNNLNEGKSFDSYCFDCSNSFRIDPNKDKHICPKCNKRPSPKFNVKADDQCPECEVGLLKLKCCSRPLID